MTSVRRINWAVLGATVGSAVLFTLLLLSPILWGARAGHRHRPGHLLLCPAGTATPSQARMPTRPGSHASQAPSPQHQAPGVQTIGRGHDSASYSLPVRPEICAPTRRSMRAAADSFPVRRRALSCVGLDAEQDTGEPSGTDTTDSRATRGDRPSARIGKPGAVLLADIEVDVSSATSSWRECVEYRPCRRPQRRADLRIDR